MAVTDDIRAALKAADKTHTLSEIAERAKITLPNLSRFRSGDKGLNVEGLERLAAALGLSITVNSEKRPEKR